LYAIHKRQNYWETERLSSDRCLSSDIIELLLLPNNWRKNNIAQSPQTYIQTAKSVENILQRVSATNSIDKNSFVKIVLAFTIENPVIIRLSFV